jgi:WD40 repeat protein
VKYIKGKNIKLTDIVDKTIYENKMKNSNLLKLKNNYNTTNNSNIQTTYNIKSIKCKNLTILKENYNCLRLFTITLDNCYYLLILTYDSYLYLLNEKGEIKLKIDLPNNAQTADYFINIQNNIEIGVLIVGCSSGNILLYNIIDIENIILSKEFNIINSHISYIKHLKNNTIAIGTTKNNLKIIDINTEKILNNLTHYSKKINSISYSGLENNFLLSSCIDNVIRIWDAETGFFIDGFKPHKDMIWSLICIEYKDTYFILTGSGDKTICMWELITRKISKKFVGHNDSVCSLYYNRDSPYLKELLFSGSYDGQIKIWQINTEKCLITINPHNERIISLFCKEEDDGDNCESDIKAFKLFTCSEDKKIKSMIIYISL